MNIKKLAAKSSKFFAFSFLLPAMGFCIASQNKIIPRNFRMSIYLRLGTFRSSPIVMKKLRMRIQIIFVAHQITS